MTKRLNNQFAGDALKKDLISQITSGELNSGDPIIAERKLAEIYNIGYMTARRAIDDLVEDGLLYRKPRKGTFVAEVAKSGFNPDSKVIAIVMSDLKNNFSSQLLESVERKARQNGFHLIICNSELDVTQESSHLIQMRDSGVAGIILNPCFPPVNREIAVSILKKNIPIVTVDKTFADLDIDSVTCDNFEGAYRAVSYLISLGYRRIAHITSHHSLSGISSIRTRLEGYKKALLDHDLPVRDEYISELDEVSVHTEMSKINLNYLGYGPMKKLLALPTPPDAVFLLFDSLAVGAYRAIRESGLKVADDISIVGFNNDELCSFLETPLTTVTQPLREIGEEAFAMLQDRIEGNITPVKHKKLKTQLIERNSCRIYMPEENEQVTA